VAKTPSIRETETPSAPSAERFYAPEPEQLAAPAPAPRWEDTNKRWTFHIPTDVLAAVEAEAARSGRSKTAVVVTLLREGLNVPAR
jgi:hypothetical protein